MEVVEPNPAVEQLALAGPAIETEISKEAKKHMFNINNIPHPTVEDAFNYCTTLPIGERYQALAALTDLLLERLNESEIYLVKALDLIERDRLFEAAGISRADYQKDREVALEKALRWKNRKSKALAKLRKNWDERGQLLGDAWFASPHISGEKCYAHMGRIAEALEPRDAVTALNSAMVERLLNPRRGRSRLKCYVPQDFWNVANSLRKIQKLRDKENGIPRVSKPDMAKLQLQYNAFGMLGSIGERGYVVEESPRQVDNKKSRARNEESPRQTDSEESLSQEEEVIYGPEVTIREEMNRQAWEEFGQRIPETARAPQTPTIMDKLVVHRSKDGEEDLSSLRHGIEIKSCKCISQLEQSWYNILDDGYLHKGVGWGDMIMLARDIGKNGEPQPCNYHLNKLANTLGLRSTRVKRDDLITRIETLFTNREDINEMRLASEYYEWFNPHPVAEKYRSQRTLGDLKYQLNPFNSERIEPKVTELVKEDDSFQKNWRLISQQLNWITHSADLQMRQLIRNTFSLYKFHQREIDNNDGILHTMYFSPLQQILRQDIAIWREMVKARGDHKFKLITIPEPARYIEENKEVTTTFMYGNCAKIYADKKDNVGARVRKEATAFIFFDHSKYHIAEKAAYTFLGNSDVDQWKDNLHTVLSKMGHPSGHYRDLTRQIAFEGFKSMLKSEDLQWMNFSNANEGPGSLAILPTGVPVCIRSRGLENRCITISYGGVQYEKDGSMSKQLDNGLSYTEVRESHEKLRPLYKYSRINGNGVHVMANCPLDVDIALSDPVSQALIGLKTWDSPSVLQTADILLGMDDKQFEEYYTNWKVQAENELVRGQKYLRLNDRRNQPASFYMTRINNTEPPPGVPGFVLKNIAESNDREEEEQEPLSEQSEQGQQKKPGAKEASSTKGKKSADKHVESSSISLGDRSSNESLPPPPVRKTKRKVKKGGQRARKKLRTKPPPPVGLEPSAQE
jgi:hypothetical protein